MSNHQKKGVTALKKAHTSLGNILALLEEDKAFEASVLQQVQAVMGLLKSSVYHLLSAHVETELNDLPVSKKKHKKSVGMLVSTIGTIIKLAQKK